MSAPLVVVGDVLLDIDVHGRADRRSPDAPVPVVDVRAQEFRPGGAGLAALLAARDADDVVLVGGFGADAAADRLRGLFEGRVWLAELPLRGTTVCKERIRATGPCASSGPRGEDGETPTPITRLDYGDGRVGDDRLTPKVRSALEAAGAILVADYGRGVSAHPELRSVLTERAARIPVVWDPHPRGAPPVPGAALVTPNRGEAVEFGGGSDDFDAVARALCERWQARAIAVTLGDRGALFHRRGGAETVAVPIPDRSRPGSGADTCGAGDRFSAAATAALRAGHGPAYAVRVAVETAAEFVCAGAASSVRIGSELPLDDHVRKAGLV
ncbi:PfkB family carbohydrate kinase [Nocardia sp. NPDC004068]|uniref:PfkB family carbohydrate kinase n=1 Tax=Nocardia sp. NPDC004068 TaxID=3364303 RepID=UPI0036A23AB2